ncbi:MAG: hypothetical protein ABJC12_09305, partial [Saprospiraceae bacterium]
MGKIKLSHCFIRVSQLMVVFTFYMTFLSKSEAQTYYTYQADHGQDFLTKITLECRCPGCCRVQPVGPTRKWESRVAMSPAGEMFGLATDLYKIDTLNGTSTLVMTLHGLGLLKGLVAMGGGIFYTTEGPTLHHTDALIKIDVGANTITNLGPLFPKACGDLCFFEGEIYYPSTQDFGFFLRHITRLDLANPQHSIDVAFVPLTYFLVGLNATDICNTLLATDTLGHQLVLVNIKDQSVTPKCSKNDGLSGMASRQEFKPTTICNVIDLDCNDSSMAFGSDFNADTVSCLTNHVSIVDNDVQMMNDTLITEIRIRLTGFVPDGASEYLQLTGSIFTIEPLGSGTQMIKLENGGPATTGDFDYLLQRIFYHNDALYPTGGTRTIEVQFTTELGSVSGIATTYIPVIELPLYPIDLGDDLVICGNQSVTLDAGNPSAHHIWSTGSLNQEIFVSQPGIYSVYVYGPNACPNRDTVFINYLPQVEVGLEGDSYTCGGDDASLTLDINSPIALDIEVTGSDGSVMLLEDIHGTYNFYAPVDSVITYTITNIIPHGNACLNVGDTTITIQSFPSYDQIFADSICEGDSILIGYDHWVKTAGVYDNSFFTEAGCDSNVSVAVTVIPLPRLFRQTTSCDISEVGVFTKHLPSAISCDTILETTVHLVASDTTRINQGVCRSAGVGVAESHFINRHGCDSLVITTSVYVAPVDTTRVFQTSCDVNELGTFSALLTDVTGCDSLVYTIVIMGPIDTTHVFSSSCDQAQVGTFQTQLLNHDGCDSLVISTVSFSLADTTYLTGTSCDPGSLGVFQSHFTAQSGCDSLVITTVTFSAHDSVSISGSSCDPNATGIFIHSFVNQFGCDSVVTETISLLHSDHVNISGISCDPASTGVFTHSLINHFGCDSIVTETITLLSTIQTSLSSITCRSLDAGVFVSTFSAQNGCDSIVTLTVSLVPADTTTLFFNTCDPNQAGLVNNTFTNQDGCDSLVISSTSLFPLPQLTIAVTSDFNGSDISCFGENNGSVIANTSGVSPLTYLWSTGSTHQAIAGLVAGDYQVTITDGNGCTSISEVSLSEPPPFGIISSITEPGCYSQHSGMISISPFGGVSPVRYSIDGINYQSTPQFDNLSEGTYELTALDANGCSDKKVIDINAPLSVNVDLGGNRFVSIGDTVFLDALVNVPYDSLASVQWTNLINPSCPACLTQILIPSVNSTYSISISVTSIDGCTDTDEIKIYTGEKTDFLVPNIFSPNGDNVNDLLWISSGPDIVEIQSWIIFDRWGNVV